MQNEKWFSIIVAVDDKNWIWKSNDLAWDLPSDRKYFKKITSASLDLAKMNAVIMWKNTWDSIPVKYKPLPNRINCVLNHKLKENNSCSKIDDFVLYFNSFENCLDELKKKENIENIFVIWWWILYNYALKSNLLEKIYITKLKWDFDCDVFFDWIPNNFVLESYTDYELENDIEYSFQVYKKNNL